MDPNLYGQRYVALFKFDGDKDGYFDSELKALPKNGILRTYLLHKLYMQV